MKSLAGNLLIASPELANDFFAQSVILMIQHSASGAAGLVLNKPSDVSVDTIWPDLLPDSSADWISIGGPCEGPVVAIHTSLELAEAPLLPGVSLSASPETVRRLLEEANQPVRLYSGYAGWSEGQLEDEIDRGGWYSIRASSDLIFADPFELWRSACDAFGKNILAPITGKCLPADPTLN